MKRGPLCAIGDETFYGTLAREPEAVSKEGQAHSAAALPPAEMDCPWIFDNKKQVVFATLPHMATEATAKLRDLLLTMAQ